MPWPELTKKEMQLKEYLATVPIKVTHFKRTGRCITFQFKNTDAAQALCKQLMMEYSLACTKLRVDETNHRLHITPPAFDILARKLGLENSEQQKPPSIRFKELKKIDSGIERKVNEIIEYLQNYGKNFYEVFTLFNLETKDGDKFRRWYQINKQWYNIDICLTSPGLLSARAATRFTFFLNAQLENLEIPNNDFFASYYAPYAPKAKANLLLICLSELYEEPSRLINLQELFKNNPAFIDSFSQDKIVVFNEIYEDYMDSLKHKSTPTSQISTQSCSETENEASTLEMEEVAPHPYNTRKRTQNMQLQKEKKNGVCQASCRLSLNN